MDLEQHLPFQIAVLSNLIKRGSSDLFASQANISANEWRVLAILNQNNAISSSTIRELTGIDKTTISKALKRLSSKELIELSADPNDRRSHLVCMTKQGLKLHGELAPKMIANGEHFKQSLSTGELQLFLELVKRLQQSAKELIN